MLNKLIYTLLLLSLITTFSSCTSDENFLTVGEDVMDDDHYAYYTEDFTIETKTMLAEYVATNNTGVALCGSYVDEYLGKIETNTVFKMIPNVSSNQDNEDIFDFTAEYDSMELILSPTGYIYGDSTVTMKLSLHQVLDDYELDTITEYYDGSLSTTYLKKNNSEIDYDPTSFFDFEFIPEELEFNPKKVIERMPDDLGQKWFDKIADRDPDYTYDTEDDKENFIENVLNGIMIRNTTTNNAVMGFHMPISTEEDDDSLAITIRLHYHTEGPYTEKYIDFAVYDEALQFNQITTDYINGPLSGIQPGGEGIPSTQTNNQTFVHAGLGLMTNIEIPTLNELYVFESNLGSDLSIINLDLDFHAVSGSFNNNIKLPTILTVDKMKQNGEIEYGTLVDWTGTAVSVYNTETTSQDASYTFPITRYGYDEQQLIGNHVSDHNSILIRPSVDNYYPANVNRLVIGDEIKKDVEMLVKMHYTLFE